MDHVIYGSFYNRTILRTNYRKNTISGSFSYNSFVQFHGKKLKKSQNDCVISKSGFNQMCYKGIAVYLEFISENIFLNHLPIYYRSKKCCGYSKHLCWCKHFNEPA